MRGSHLLLQIVVLVVLCALTDGKGGSSSYGGRGAATGAYSAGRSSRYAMYPAAGVLVYWGMSRRYRAHGYRDRYYNSDQQANQAQSYRYLNLTFVFPVAQSSMIGEFRFTDSAGSVIPTDGVVIENCADLVGCAQAPNLFDGNLETTFDFGTTTSGAQVSLVLDFGSAHTFREYEIAPASGAGSFLSWSLSGGNSGTGPWSDLDSYGSLTLTTTEAAESYVLSNPDYAMVVPDEFIVTSLGTSARCPASYKEVTSITYNVEGSAASKAGVDSISTYECASACDEKGLGCSSFRTTYENGMTSCYLSTADEENGAQLKTEPFLGSTKCTKDGLMNCSQAVCPAVVSRRLVSVGPMLALSSLHQQHQQSSVLPAGTAVLFGQAMAHEHVHRHLMAPNSTTVCSTCPTFKYDEEEDKAGAIVGAIFGIIAVIICCVCLAQKKRGNQTHQSPQVHNSNFNQPPAFSNQNFTSVMPQSAQPQMVQVTVPPGVFPGQTIAVQSSVGVVQAQVPANATPGSTFLISVGGGPVQPQYAFGGKALA